MLAAQSLSECVVCRQALKDQHDVGAESVAMCFSKLTELTDGLLASSVFSKLSLQTACRTAPRAGRLGCFGMCLLHILVPTARKKTFGTLHNCACVAQC